MITRLLDSCQLWSTAWSSSPLGWATSNLLYVQIAPVFIQAMGGCMQRNSVSGTSTDATSHSICLSLWSVFYRINQSGHSAAMARQLQQLMTLWIITAHQLKPQLQFILPKCEFGQECSSLDQAFNPKYGSGYLTTAAMICCMNMIMCYHRTRYKHNHLQ